MFCSQIFKFWRDIQGSHLIGYLWVSLIIDRSECLICYFLCSELTFFCTELTLFCTELPENCIYLNQSELWKFSMYIIRSVITKVIKKIRQPLSRSLIRQLRIQLQTQVLLPINHNCYNFLKTRNTFRTNKCSRDNVEAKNSSTLEIPQIF